jgi:molybdopterin synthase sulfur carrier subunit
MRMLLCAWTHKHRVVYWLLFHKTSLISWSLPGHGPQLVIFLQVDQRSKSAEPSRANNQPEYPDCMATVRFFAQAREAAGTGTATITGVSVGEVLDSAVALYGNQFEAVLGMSKVWLNGEEVSREHPVTDKDEVAVLPPVSGGI